MDSLLELAIGDYEQYILDWLIEAQWTSLYGLNLDEQSLTRALTKRSLDWETQYTYAYSKIVGLQAGGDWVLKKDYVDLVPNQQIYEIPKGREINELLWFMRAELNNSLFDPFMGGFGGHLYNTPGGRFDFSNIGFNEYRCWYWYYDTDGDRDDCLAANPDIVRLPSDIPLEALNWQDLNTPAQQWVRRWFTAYCKETLGRIYGKYSGNLKTPDSELTLDYTSLLGEAKDERAKLEEELKLRLERLSPVKQMEKEALIAENLNKQLKYRAFPSPYNVI